MNPEDYSRDDLISTGPILLGFGWLVAVVLWYVSVKARQRFPSAVWPLRVAGFLLASLGFWLAFQLLAKFCALATSWSLVFVALLGGLATEIIIWLYEFEKSIVPLKRGRILLALRLAALITLITILIQPVRSFLEEREINREIAVLIDESDSMQLSDQRLTVSEVLDRAEVFESPLAAKRPPLHQLTRLTADLKAQIQSEIEAISSAPSAAAGLENRSEQWPTFFESASATNKALFESITGTLNDHSQLSGEVRGKLNEYLRRSRDAIGKQLPAANDAVAGLDGEAVLNQLNASINELNEINKTLPLMVNRADEGYFNSLNEADKKALNDIGTRPRLELAMQALQGNRVRSETQQGTVDDPTLLGQLKENYNLRMYRFSRDIEEVTELNDLSDPEATAEAVKAQTDLSGALEHVLENSSPESLAGILLLSDGRHNAAALPEDSLRQLAVQNSPLSAVPIGGDLGPIDISLLSLNAPESIYLDDRVVIKAEAKLDGLLGKKVKAELVSNGEVVMEQVIDVTDVSYRTELRFVHTPEEKGILDYEVRLEPDEREIFQNNNSWDFKVAVTDDRTNVLLVDNFPRWEFRYLRNLFYGRDKSVHLQYVLLNPDGIDRSVAKQPVAASATRKFGEAEATMLPSSPDEWQLFDVIILGDIPSNALNFREWKAIEEAVTKRGALLVCVGGPRHMPHQHDSDVLQNLLPINYTPSGDDQFAPPEKSYRIQLSNVGRGHQVTSQSTSRSLNMERWNEFPKMTWRYIPDGVKEGAEVLAYALPEGAVNPKSGNVTADGSPGSVEAAIQQLANQKTFEAENSLITTMRAGLGKVVMMNFDQTWRFRYGVGDTYHHRFWGQLTRWGAGENLRSGGEQVRLGTDRLSYTPSDAIQIKAKVLDDSRKPVTDADVYANVFLGEKRITRQKMSYRTDSSGIYETTVSGLSEEGEYTVKVEGAEIEDAIAAAPEGPQEIATEIVVVKTRNPVELAELTADRDFLNRATSMTNGQIAELWNLDSLLNAFGAPKETLTERRNVTLWDKWPLLVLFLGLLTTEWVLRRRTGLV